MGTQIAEHARSDPLLYVGDQLSHLEERLAAIEREVRDLRAQRIEDVQTGCELVLDKLTNDSKFGSLHYTAAADHMGRRWSDKWKNWLGGWMTKLVGGALLTTVLWWYFAGRGK